MASVCAIVPMLAEIDRFWSDLRRDRPNLVNFGQFRIRSAKFGLVRLLWELCGVFGQFPATMIKFGADSTRSHHFRQICLDLASCRTQRFTDQALRRRVAAKILTGDSLRRRCHEGGESGIPFLWAILHPRHPRPWEHRGVYSPVSKGGRNSMATASGPLSCSPITCDVHEFGGVAVGPLLATPWRGRACQRE